MSPQSKYWGACPPVPYGSMPLDGGGHRHRRRTDLFGDVADISCGKNTVIRYLCSEKFSASGGAPILLITGSAPEPYWGTTTAYSVEWFLMNQKRVRRQV